MTNINDNSQKNQYAIPLDSSPYIFIKQRMEVFFQDLIPDLIDQFPQHTKANLLDLLDIILEESSDWTGSAY